MLINMQIKPIETFKTRLTNIFPMPHFHPRKNIREQLIYLRYSDVLEGIKWEYGKAINVINSSQYAIYTPLNIKKHVVYQSHSDILGRIK